MSGEHWEVDVDGRMVDDGDQEEEDGRGCGCASMVEVLWVEDETLKRWTRRYIFGQWLGLVVVVDYDMMTMIQTADNSLLLLLLEMMARSYPQVCYDQMSCVYTHVRTMMECFL